jgi:hypothetical protein
MPQTTVAMSLAPTIIEIRSEISSLDSLPRKESHETWFAKLGLLCLTCHADRCVKLGLAVAAALLCAVALCSLVVWSWTRVLTADIVEGAFSLSRQTEGVDVASDEIFKQSLEFKTFSHLAGPAERSADPPPGFFWRRFEIVYHMSVGTVLSEQGLAMIAAIEKKLRGLRGWQQLCGDQVPLAQQHHCNPGNSLASIALGKSKQVDTTLSSLGVIDDFEFNGEGPELLLPYSRLIAYVKSRRETNQELANRWFVEMPMTPIRSVFILLA